MRKLIILYVILILSTVSCGSEGAGKVTSGTQNTTSSSAESTAAEKDRFGYGLLDTGIYSVRHDKPEYDMGIALRETYLFPAPSEEVYELGVIYQGREVKVLYRVDVSTFKEYDHQAVHEDYSWLLVETEGISTIGFVRAEDIGDAEKTEVKKTEPYQIKSGEPFYYKESCTTPMTRENPVGPLWVVAVNEETDIYELEGYSGFTAFVKAESLEAWPNIGSKRVSHGS